MKSLENLVGGNIIQIKEVKQSFKTGFWMKEVEILKGINLDIEAGSVIGLLGPNGAGKTTLIHLITGLRTPIQGQVFVGGHPAESLQARKMIGYLPERPYFHEFLTGRNLLRYMGSLSGLSSGEVDSRIPKILKSVRMEHAADKELKTYSKGMLQRIGLAQAILPDPEILIFDEPMSGLDPLGRKEIRELILKLAEEGKTIFFSSHVIPDVEAICQKVAVIENGKLKGFGSISQFLQEENTKVEIAFSQIPFSKLKFKKNIIIKEGPISEGHRIIIQSVTDLNKVVKNIIDAGGTLLWATPLRPSLERVFDEDAESNEK